MNELNKLKKYQPIAYKLFENVLSNNNFFHAYLLSGQKGSSLGKTASFLAKSLLCEEDIFACNSCNICKRFDNNNYPDFLRFDAKNNPLEIGDIRKLEDLFSKTSSDERQIKIYIIENIEYLSNQISNAILKFLEEPPSNTYAIFTTENETNILPTIISRVEIIRFKNIEKEEFIELAKEDNVDNDDIYLLSILFNDYEEIIKNVNNDEFQIAKEMLFKYLSLLENKDDLTYFIEKELIPNIKTKEKSYYFLDLLIEFLKEANEIKLNIKDYEETFLKKYDQYLDYIISNIKDIPSFIDNILLSEFQIAKNLNLSLLLLNTLIVF